MRPKKLKEKEDEKEKLGTWPTIMVSQLFLLSFVRSLALVVGAATFSTFFLGFTYFQDAADTDGLEQPKHVTMIIGRSSATIHYQLDGWRLSLGVLPSLSIPY